MMRRGPLAEYPIDKLLTTAAAERLSGVIVLRSSTAGSVFLVDGDLYLAELDGQPPLEERLVAAGLLSREQVERYSEPGEEGPYLGLALDTDSDIDESRIGEFLLDVTASALVHFAAATDGEFELDPYSTHPAGILASWPPSEVFERMRWLRDEAARLEAERAESERAESERAESERAEAERAEAERAEAERAEVERAEAERDQAGEAATEPEVPGADLTGHPPPPSLDTPPPPAAPIGEQAPAPRGGDLDPKMLVVTHDEPPAGIDSIELQPVEWRIVVLAAQGISLSDLSVRLGLDTDAVRGLVDGLTARGLLAAVG